MKVRELIEELQKMDGDLLVVLQIDPEGNGYDTVSGVEGNSVYDHEDREVYIKKLTGALKSQGYTQEDVGEGEDCVVIYP